MAALRTCPRCGSKETVRSRRRPVEHLLLLFRPFRCTDCQYRFFSFVGLKEEK